MVRKLVASLVVAVTTIVLAASVCHAGNWPGTKAIDFPIRKSMKTLQFCHEEEVIEVHAKPAPDAAAKWMPLRPDFLDACQSVLHAGGSIADLQAVAHSDVPAKTQVNAALPCLDKCHCASRCYIVNRGKHPIWLRARELRSSQSSSWHRTTDEWYKGTGDQGTFRFQTYFVTKVTKFVPVMSKPVRTQHVKVWKHWRVDP